MSTDKDLRAILADKQKLRNLSEAAFKKVDIDQSGFVEKNELQKVMEDVAKDIGTERPSKDDVDEVLKELDENKDGKLSLDEFQVLIEQVLEQMVRIQEEMKG
jgi:calmodulin